MNELQIWWTCPPQYLWQPECDFPVEQITFSANGQIVAVAGEKHVLACIFPPPITWATSEVAKMVIATESYRGRAVQIEWQFSEGRLVVTGIDIIR